ncbi:MAG: hypothetical protein HYU54_08370 [Actinobacteria bacterium]|nr:hypothetical protein [Actinomycetota bacterium]
MRKIAILAGALVLAVATGVAVSASPGTVLVRGGEKFVPNALIQSTFRFSPGGIMATSGQVVTWTDAALFPEPHTVTIVDQSDLPADIEEVFGCQGPEEVCGKALAGHFPEDAPPVVVLNVGDPGLGQAGDSLLFFPGGSISATVSAAAGTTLYYLCAIHPWMQGSIAVG